MGGAFAAQPNDTLDLGADGDSPVAAYGNVNKYAGKLGTVKIQLLK